MDGFVIAVAFQGSKKDEGSSSSAAPSVAARVWQPGVDKIEEGEELQCDPSAYNSLHAFHVGWPCLRFFSFFQRQILFWVIAIFGLLVFHSLPWHN